MPHLKISPHGDGAWPDVDATTCLKGELVAIARLPAGMQSGRSSVALRIRLDDGRDVFAQTSLALFVSAARAFNFAEQDAQESASMPPAPGTR